jgi:hypothetical protein
MPSILGPLDRRQSILIAELSNRYTFDQLHDEIGPTPLSVVE